MNVSQAIVSRRSIRAFDSTPVPRTTIEQIIKTASRAPSNSNMQPWKVYAVDGEKLTHICDKACNAHNKVQDNLELAQEYRAGHEAHPRSWPSPFDERRRENGKSLYNLLGIKKEDRNLMHQQQQQNYRFFGASVGLFFTVNSSLSKRMWTDHGMFLENIVLLAQEQGLDTCLIGAWTAFAKIVLEEINAGDQETLVCGMAMGYPDKHAVVNTLCTPRAPLEEFFTWVN